MDVAGQPISPEQEQPKVETPQQSAEAMTTPAPEINNEPKPEVFADVAPAGPASTQQSVVDDNIKDEDKTDVSPDDVESAPQTVLDDTLGSASDDQYIDHVKKIIAEDKDNPYKEEEDSEALQKDYLANRFDVKIQKEGE